MMSVQEYAEEMNFNVQAVLSKCKELNIKAYNKDDMLDDEAIILLDNTMNLINTDEELNKEDYIQKAKKIIKDCTDLVNELRNSYLENAKGITMRLLKPLYGDSIEVAYGKFKGKYSLEDIIENVHHDITWWDKWLNSAANTNELGIKGIDNVLKKIKSESKSEVIQYKNVIYALA